MSTSTSSLQLEPSEQSLPSWKDEVNARLAAHRTRRAKPGDMQSHLPGFENTVSRQESLAARVAARVAERYSNAPTYSEMLAEEAANAARAAEAAALAAQQAHIAAEAIFAELESAAAQARQKSQAGSHTEPQATQQPGQVDLTPPSMTAAAPQFFAAYHQPLPQHRDAQAQQDIDRDFEQRPVRSVEYSGKHEPSAVEIVDPFEDATVAAAQPLLAKLIEFPRELIATRKARPRLAEGPLRESDVEPERSQLRIFEVEPENISNEVTVDPALPDSLPEWHSIRLSARPEPENPERDAAFGHGRSIQPAEGVRPGSRFELPLKIAPLEDRLMAAVVDLALGTAAFLLFVLVFTACATHLPSGKTAVFAGGLVLAVFFLAYQWLFFSYAEATPGMRYAKIALCTFEDENPSRRTMRGRIGALLLAALPLGLGFAWTFFDVDRLGWHDRMTRTYQRSCR